ncbi:tyrosine-protein kinase transmembrane receptor Ror [Capsaspora owczarzaki ATCC 30864]|uniref:tyrosine-protein kinase transmembrane receptor Ror n=1 Tax=Capsaspora owczarzaki (strain ATCC 30864) TaxID=595528 RepID=UPI0003524525|nr:tyrosine-protein kinase transmembrane receptor Ror [Capsaspora owczarzaki ATCC 30864]|eukprot:XP_004348193.2 tyrosine-protein kinase transmembrane receptor Ror [Capsaspora owczarzaki ATCC 30864]
MTPKQLAFGLLLLFCVVNHLQLAHAVDACSVCNCGATIVSCEGRTLTAIPSGIPVTTVVLQLYSNQITGIPANALTGLTALRILHLYSNQITSISASAFTGLMSLNQLFLFSNPFTTLPPGLFKGLPNVLYLTNLSNRLYLYLSPNNFTYGGNTAAPPSTYGDAANPYKCDTVCATCYASGNDSCCGPNCLTCTSSAACNQCYDGYGLMSGSCVPLASIASAASVASTQAASAASAASVASSRSASIASASVASVASAATKALIASVASAASTQSASAASVASTKSASVASVASVSVASAASAATYASIASTQFASAASTKSASAASIASASVASVASAATYASIASTQFASAASTKSASAASIASASVASVASAATFASIASDASVASTQFASVASIASISVAAAATDASVASSASALAALVASVASDASASAASVASTKSASVAAVASASVASVASAATIATIASDASAVSFQFASAASVASTKSVSAASIASALAASGASVASSASASAASVASSIATIGGGSQGGSSSAAAVAAAGASVAIIAIIAVAFLVLRRRRSQRRSIARPKDSARPVYQEALEMSISPSTESYKGDDSSAPIVYDQIQPEPQDPACPIYLEADEVTISPLNHSTRAHTAENTSASAVPAQKQPEPLYQAMSITSTDDYASVYVEGSNSRHIREDLTLVKHLASGNFGDVALGQVPFSVLPQRAQSLLGPAASDTVQVAVKSLKSDADEKSRKDFESEAKLMAPFVHPNVVRLLAALVESEPHLVLLEFVQYGDLRTLLQKSKLHSLWWTQNEQVHAIRQIALGMEYLGTLHFVHRDLAARNCLVGQGMVVKIADFGLSRELTDENDYYRMETRGKLPVKWMAPETITFRKFSSMSDVWSFGVTAWECCSYGTMPYRKMSGAETLAHVEAGGRLPQPEYCATDLFSLMLSCWSLLPELRPNFTQLVKALATFEDGTPIRDIGGML